MKIISRIAYSNDKRNMTRSILIMMAICLTTMLLVIISTMGNGVIRLQKSQAASSYGSNYGLFIAADGTQLKEVERRAEISDIGIMCNHYNCLSIFFCCHLKQGDYLITGLGIKISCRLICKYNFRTIHQCSCNCYSLLLSSG